MTKTLLKTVLVAAAFSAVSITADAQAKRLLVTRSNFGDYMGEASKDVCTKKDYYFYDKDLNLSRMVGTAAGTVGGLYTQYYDTYNYEDGKLQTVDRNQYGLYDYGDRAMKNTNLNKTCKYDEQGRLAEQTDEGVRTVYEYDAEGHLVKETNYVTGRWFEGEQQGAVVEYSDFNALGLPEMMNHTYPSQPTYTGEWYREIYTYDEQGNKLSAMRECNRDYEGDWGMTSNDGDFMQLQLWSYDKDGVIEKYEKFAYIDEETGDYVPYMRIIYNRVDGDNNKLSYQSEEYFGGSWYTSGTLCVDEYKMLEPQAESSKVTSVEQLQDGINNVLVSFTGVAGATSYDVYRNGELVGNVPAGNTTFTDKGVENNFSYDYFIEPKVNEEDTYIISNSVSASIYTELPAATNLQVLNIKANTDGSHTVKIGFDQPKNADDYGFISNELMVNGSQLSSAIDVRGTASNLSETMFGTTADMYILTRYHYGKVQSEHITVDVENPDAPTAIESLEEATAGKAMYFDFSGRQVTNLQSGAYIKVQNGKARKVMVK